MYNIANKDKDESEFVNGQIVYIIRICKIEIH